MQPQRPRRYAPEDRIPRRDQIKIFERVHEAVSAKKLELVGETMWRPFRVGCGKLTSQSQRAPRCKGSC